MAGLPSVYLPYIVLAHSTAPLPFGWNEKWRYKRRSYQKKLAISWPIGPWRIKLECFFRRQPQNSASQLSHHSSSPSHVWSNLNPVIDGIGHCKLSTDKSCMLVAWSILGTIHTPYSNFENYGLAYLPFASDEVEPTTYFVGCIGRGKWIHIYHILAKLVPLGEALVTW